MSSPAPPQCSGYALPLYPFPPACTVLDNQKFMAAYVALQGRTVGLRSVAERLLEFMFTQASQLENGQSYEDDGIHQDGGMCVAILSD